MKRVAVLPIILLVLIVVFPIVSAQATIVIEQQPNNLYNYGERINIPVMVSSSQGVYDFLIVSLLCDNQERLLPKDSVDIFPGEVKEIDKSVLLIKRFIGDIKGACKIKVSLENAPSNYVFSNSFTISNSIMVKMQTDKLNMNPGENVVINGSATNENGKASTGAVELNVLEGENVINTYQGIVNNGVFTVGFKMPEGTKAGTYSLALNVHETDPIGEITNIGAASGSIDVNQVSTNLEIIFENVEVIPGENMKVKTILRDQTGEKISSEATIQVKNKNNKVVSQSEVATDEYFEFPIASNEPPSLWGISASADGITRESTFSVAEKESVKIEIENKTIFIVNDGNVLYNKTTLVKIGNKTLEIDVYLEVGKSQRYLVTAPDGNYKVEVISGDSIVSEDISLTGKVIDVRKASSRAGSLVKHSSIWIFMMLVLGFVLFLVFRKGYQRTFIGYISSRIKQRSSGKAMHREEEVRVSGNDLIKPSSRADVSLSIKGAKQDVCVVALNIKNLKDVQAKKGNARETLQKISDMAEEKKAATHENGNTIFFILSPEKTRTYKNEKAALDIAGNMREILANHNKLFHQKIKFGISINHGEMVAKQESSQGPLKFMSLGTLMASSKKIAVLANDDILISEKMNDKLMSYLKTTRQEKEGIAAYSIKEVKIGSEENQDFLRRFLSRNK